MDSVESRLHTISLLEAYGALLTESQKFMMDDYFLYDLSLSEIASERDVSRSAVSDSINKSLAKLEEFEDRLSLVKSDHDRAEIIKAIRAKEKDPDILSLLDTLEDI